MHEVHARIFLLAPFTTARTGRRFTFQRRLLTLWAWLMLLPNCGPLPHISHTRAITDSKAEGRASGGWCRILQEARPRYTDRRPSEGGTKHVQSIDFSGMKQLRQLALSKGQRTVIP